MRITIGGILLVGGVVVVAVVGPLSNSGDLLKQAVDGVTSLVKSISGPAVIPIPAPAPSDNTNTASVSTTTAVVPTTVAPAIADATATTISPPPVAAAPHVVNAGSAPQPAPASPAVVAEKHLGRKHRRVRRKKVVVAKPTPAAAAAPAARPAKATSNSDPLIGQYVAVKLKTGREVKGILQARTSQGISLEIPGMGPFQYPATNIDGIKAAP